MLRERVRRALAPDYDVLTEIAAGGMGLVFSARQVRLDRPVAVKVLRPEHATAIAVERFLAEGRALARLTHPNVVPVFDAGEADGLLYYVMELVEGETLADRLKRGPLTEAEGFRLGQDLLAALAAAHRLEIVHRDVKPGNIFLRSGSALLGDFGLALWREESDSGRTATGQLIGTPRYMAPEQRESRPATPATDVYAAGMVLYEALTGTSWPLYQDPAKADWTGVPAPLVAALRRALQLAPPERWPDAAAFRSAWRVSRSPSPGLVALAGGLAVVVVTALWLAWRGPDPRATESGRAGLILAIPPFEVVGTPDRAGLGDSLAAGLRRSLEGWPDFQVVERSDQTGAIHISGRAEIRGDRVMVRLRGAGGPDFDPVSLGEIPLDSWRVELDSLTLLLVHSLVQSQVVGDRWLPRALLPVSLRGLALWLKAEQYWSRNQGDSAFQAYRLAVERDTTCLICSFRLTDVGRWVEQRHDPLHQERIRAATDRFPAHYQALIRALDAPLPDRLDRLKRAAAEQDQFYLAWMYLGDEQFHRGPLYGLRRAEAIESFQNAVRLQPRFAPGWQHLAWVLIGEGDSLHTAAALRELHQTTGAGPYAASLAALVSVGFAWRFLPEGEALALSRRQLAAQLREFPDAVGAARVLMSMDEARGAIGVGRLLAERRHPGAPTNGLLGQLFGFAAMGRLDSMPEVRRALSARVGDPAVAQLALELEAILRAFDPDSGVRHAPDLVRALSRSIGEAAGSEELRRRAAFALGLLALRSGADSALALAQRTLVREPEPARLRRILAAAERARRGDPGGAIRALPPLTGAEAGPFDQVPTEDAVQRLLRAEWSLDQGRPGEARQALRWHEHLHISGHLVGPPQSGEVAWALGTLVRWQRRALLERIGPASDAEWCSVNRGIVRAWAAAPEPFGSRAELARRSLSDSACGAAQ